MAALDMNDFSTDMSEKKVIRSEKKLRVGIIGTGGIAESHIDSYLKQPDVEVVAGADLIPGKAEKFFKDHGVDAKGVYGLQGNDRYLCAGRRQRLHLQPHPQGVYRVRSGARNPGAIGEAYDRYAG